MAADPGGRAQRLSPPAGLFAAASVVGAVALVGIVATRPAALEYSPAADTRSAARRAAPAPVYPRVVRSIDARRPGEAAYARGDVPAALNHFQQAVDADPTDPEALNNLGQLLVRSGRAVEAMPFFDRAVRIAPDRWAYRFNRARGFAELGQWGSAVEGYRDALERFPDDYATAFNLAKALQASGDLPGAIEGFERAIRLAPGQADFHLSHGLALEAAGRPTDAAAAYGRYLELAEDAPDAETVKARMALLDQAPAASR
ncbi:MAG: tetratricopeptide repeat protein [Vicinamibacterales bacterium]